MSLAKRLRSLGGGGVASSGRILPYDCCSEYLESHPMIQAYRLSSRDIHSALVHIDKLVTKSITTTPDDSVSSYVERCIECSGIMELSARDGHMVCSECGLIPHNHSINVVREYDAPVKNDDPVKQRGPRGVRGVPTWMVQKNACSSDHVHSYMDDLAHYNHYTGLSTDTLTDCNTLLTRWTGGHFSREQRIVTALIYHVIQSQILEETDVRSCIRRGGSLRSIVDQRPPATFPCSKCGTMEYSRRAAAYHCKKSRVY